MGQTATSETEAAPEVDAFRERVRELREKLERAQGARLDMPPPEKPAPRAAAQNGVAKPKAEALPAAIEQRMVEATQRIEQLAARETDLTNLLRRTRAELDSSERAQEGAVEALRLAEERASAAEEDTDQARAVADGLRQQVDAQRKRIEALSAENRALQERNDRIARELQSAGQREKDARDELKRLQHAFDALQESYDEVRRQKSDVEEKLTRTSGRINEFETELMGQLQHLEGEYARIEGVAGAARREADDAAAAREALAEEGEVKDALLAELREELERESRKRAEESDKRRDIDARLETLQAELGGLQSRYAADLVELDAARQSAARFEKRAADLTDELQAQRRLMEQHETAFAQMDLLFRSLDGRNAEASSPVSQRAAEEKAPLAMPAHAVTTAPTVDRDVRSTLAPSPKPATAVARAATKPMARAEAPQRLAAITPLRPAPRVTRREAPSGQVASPASAGIADAQPASVRPTARIVRAAPGASASAASGQGESASGTARDRLGRSLEALQALADKHKSAERAILAERRAPASAPEKTSAATPTPRPADRPAPQREVPEDLPDTEAVATPRPVVSAPPVETPAAAEVPATTETRDGFVMPKPRLIRRD